MFEPPANIFWRDLCESVFQGGPQFSLRAGLERAENRFEFGNALFNRIKVWRVRGQILHTGPGCFDQADSPRAIMKFDIIQKHDVVGVQVWREQMFRAVQVRTKAHAFIGNFSQLGKTENLEASGIGKNGAIPRHKFVEASHPPDQLMARTQIKMVGITKNDFGAEFLERFVAQAFYRRLRANRHEERRFNRAVRRG